MLLRCVYHAENADRASSRVGGARVQLRAVANAQLCRAGPED